MNKTPLLIAQRIHACRSLAHLSQRQVADHMRDRGHEWHQQTVGYVEQSRRSLTLDEAMDLAGALGVSLNQLAGVDPVEF